MLADKGEKLDANAAVRMIKRFWRVVKTEYCSSGSGGRIRGVVSVCWCELTDVA